MKPAIICCLRAVTGAQVFGKPILTPDAYIESLDLGNGALDAPAFLPQGSAYNEPLFFKDDSQFCGVTSFICNRPRSFA